MMGNKASNYYQVIQNALDILRNKDRYCYFYGAKGQVMTDAMMDALIAHSPDYFSRYSPTKLYEIKNYSRGKIGLDCSGFINACTGQENYSTGYYTDTLNKTTPKLGTEGNVLYTTHGGKGRHIGLDIGYGYCLSFEREGESCYLGMIKLMDWEDSGQLKGIDYTGAKN